MPATQANQQVRKPRLDWTALLSKQSFEPSSHLPQFKQRVPSKSEAQAGLIGGTIVPQTSDPNSRGSVTTAISAETPQAMQFVDGSALASLFRSFNGSSNSTKVQSDSGNVSRSIQWVGAFCREVGVLIFADASQTQDSQALVGEGEGDDPLVPTFEIPPLASLQYASNLSLFAPPSQSTSSAIPTLGAFTASSLTSPDYTLPGLNFDLMHRSHASISWGHPSIFAMLGHSRQKVQARSAVPFAVKLLQGFQVDGTSNVPTAFTFVGCDLA